MAKVIGVLVPNDLRPAYRKLFPTPTAANNFGPITVGARPFFPEDYTDPVLKLRRKHAEFTADWLAGHHPTAASIQGRAAFVSSRVSELMAGIFNPDFFATAEQISNTTEYGTPYVYIPGPAQPPQFAEPSRLNSYSSFNLASSAYTTPAPGTGLPNPSPGYYGEVQGGYFRDLWLAQQRTRHVLPSVLSARAPRPIWWDISISCDARASHRYNKTMFGFRLALSFGENGYQQYQEQKFIIYTARYESNRLRFRTASTPGYNRAASWRKWEVMYTDPTGADFYTTNSKTIDVILCPQPSMGIYHFGNLWQSTSWIFAPTVYVPKVEISRPRWTLDPIKV